jgi:hypothetical protein
MPKWCILSYLASTFFLVWGFIKCAEFIHLFSKYTEEETFFGIHGYGNVKLLIASVSLAAFIMNTLLLNVETSISREWKQYIHGRLLRSFVEPIYNSSIPHSFFTEGVYYSWMMFYLLISLVVLLLITIFALYWVLVYCMRLTCLGQKGDAAEFVELVSESSPDFDDKMTAAHFCSHKNKIQSVTQTTFVCYALAFLMQVNLMCAIVVQQYRLRHSGDLVPLVAPRNILLEPVGHFDSDGHMDHKSVHDDINAVNQQLHDEEVEEAKELGLDDTSAQDTVAEQAE